MSDWKVETEWDGLWVESDGRVHGIPQKLPDGWTSMGGLPEPVTGYNYSIRAKMPSGKRHTLPLFDLSWKSPRWWMRVVRAWWHSDAPLRTKLHMGRAAVRHRRKLT